MKFSFKKISAIATSALMLGMSAGVAVAASYPEPFISGGSANVAIVYGTGAGVSALDLVQAGNIQSNLQSNLGSAGTTVTSGSVTGGDSVKFEKSSTKFQLGKGITDIISTSITDDSPGEGLKVLLADGKYVDDDNDEKDYTQKIDMANLTLGMFDDDDYKPDTPTIGFRVTSASQVLNYTLDFTDEPEWADLTSTNIEIMGKTYFILSVTANTTINLLDSANTATVSEGETASVTVEGTTYEVSIQYISSTEVKLTINGENTNSLQESHTQKLKNGAYVGIKDIMHDSKTGSVSSVEFSIGTGKLILKDATDVEINDASVSNMKTYITTTSSSTPTISKIVIEWKADDELFIAPDSEVTMPGFGAVKLSFSGMLYPKEEVITVKGGSTTYAVLENFPMKDGSVDINILYGNSSDWTGIGKDSTHLLRTDVDSDITFDKDTDEYFVASFNDGSNAESYLMRATDFGQIGTTTANRTDIQYRKDGVWTTIKDDAKLADVVTIGNVQLTIGAIKRSAENTVVLTAGTSCNFHTAYSKEGLEVFLPYAADAGPATARPGALNTTNVTHGGTATTFDLIFSEEDKNGNIGDGGNITAVLGWNSATTKEAYVSDVGNESVTFAEDGDSTKKWLSYKYGALASKLLWDKTGDQYELQITYHGDESYGEVYLTAPLATVSAGTTSTTTATQLGDVLVKDSEVSSVSSKNLIIVGGSCINSAAAKVLGGTYCGAGFTEATGVGAGEFLIQSVGDAYSTGKIALVVAGYEAADTVNAATYLRTQTVDTTAGKKYKGTSSTSAELVTTTV
ncbi:MAG: hypothetical protein KKF68_00140 [Nanoarchaeota archaeon]|nr:hypothetical protein [Nanoarchaeota archaeon]